MPWLLVLFASASLVLACSDGSSSNQPDGGDGGDTDTDTDTDTLTCVEDCVSEDTFDEVDCPDTYDSASVVHVDADVAEPGEGLSWQTALAAVQQGIDAARCAAVASSGTCQVWVAEGTYNIYQQSCCDTVRLRPGVEVYGGFAGTESALEERDVEAHPAVLDGHDAEEGECRVYHVVTGSDDAVLDGLTITGGYAGGDPPHNAGAGMLNVDVSPEVRNCVFVANEAYATHGLGTDSEGDYAACSGAGMYNSNASPLVTGCAFRENVARAEPVGSGKAYASGGGMSNIDGSAPVMIDCVFDDNNAVWSPGDIDYSQGGSEGGGVYSWESAPVFEGCVFLGNSSGGVVGIESQSEFFDCVFENNIDGDWPGGSGGALRDGDGTVSIDGCTFTGNYAGAAGGAVKISYSVATITDCAFQGNESLEGGAINIWNNEIVTSAVISGCSFVDNEGELGGALYNQGKTIVSACLFQGNMAWNGGAITTFAGELQEQRFESCVFLDNEALCCGGGIFTESGPVVVVESTFTDNTAGEGGGALCTELIGVIDLTVFRNSVLWGNQPDEVHHNLDPLVEITHSVIQGGHVGDGNLDVDPLFVDPDVGDLHLQPGSPCIDAADGTVAPELDYDGNPRIDDLDTPNTGLGPPWADMGAFEYQP